MRDNLGRFVKGFPLPYKVKANKTSFKKDHPFYKGGEKGWFKKGQTSGSKNCNWKGGRKTNETYVFVYSPNHPSCYDRGFVLEHRLVMEKHLGRYLKPKEIVHHKNGNTFDNRLSNLILFINNSEHIRFHYINL